VAVCMCVRVCVRETKSTRAHTHVRETKSVRERDKVYSVREREVYSVREKSVRERDKVYACVRDFLSLPLLDIERLSLLKDFF